MTQFEILINDDTFQYDIENLIAIFILKSQFSFLRHGEPFTRDDHLTVWVKEDHIDMTLHIKGTMTSLQLNTLDVDKKEIKRHLKKTLYTLMSHYYESMSQWGILVGIRPVKIVHELMDQGENSDSIRQILADDYLISEGKINLLLEIAQRERPHLIPVDEDSVSLYLCIPFCPTKCLYCSFPSNPMAQKGKLLEDYLQKLVIELEVAMSEIKSHGKYVDCIYIGGGTPTVLSDEQFDFLLKHIHKEVDMSIVKEFTVEAGRPDTITKSKLEVLKAYGVDRICVNPQTMSDQTLITIGRSHDASAIESVMTLARQVGFESINMDLIMGLPGETLEDASRTIEKIIDMHPENVTIHTLAVKRASRLNENIEHIELQHDKVVADMLALSEQRLRSVGITPYYMYRQKKMIGHLENVGYASKGHSSLYNMRIMEERHTIMALGAGAASKICRPSENRFERVANFKGLEDYLNRFDEVLARKKCFED